MIHLKKFNESILPTYEAVQFAGWADGKKFTDACIEFFNSCDKLYNKFPTNESYETISLNTTDNKILDRVSNVTYSVLENISDKASTNDTKIYCSFESSWYFYINTYKRISLNINFEKETQKDSYYESKAKSKIRFNIVKLVDEYYYIQIIFYNLDDRTYGSNTKDKRMSYLLDQRDELTNLIDLIKSDLGKWIKIS